MDPTTTRAKRHDRYSTVANAVDVFAYMVQRVDAVASLFKVRGVHRATFKAQLIELAGLSGNELHQALSSVCGRWDKSDSGDFKKYKGRVRRYLHARRNSQAIFVRGSTKLELEKYVTGEALQGADEAIAQLLHFWRVNQS